MPGATKKRPQLPRPPSPAGRAVQPSLFISAVSFRQPPPVAGCRDINSEIRNTHRTAVIALHAASYGYVTRRPTRRIRAPAPPPSTVSSDAIEGAAPNCAHRMPPGMPHRPRHIDGIYSQVRLVERMVGSTVRTAPLFDSAGVRSQRIHGRSIAVHMPRPFAAAGVASRFRHGARRRRRMRIAYTRAGAGPPLIMFTVRRATAAPGNGCCPTSHGPHRHRLGRPGLREVIGHRRQLASGQFADALAAFIAALSLKRPHLVGHSFGTMVALSLFQRHPTVPASLVLIGGYAGWAGSLPQDEVTRRLEMFVGMAELGDALTRSPTRACSPTSYRPTATSPWSR